MVLNATGSEYELVLEKEGDFMSLLDEQLINISKTLIDEDSVSLLYDNQTIRDLSTTSEPTPSTYSLTFTTTSYESTTSILSQYLQSYFFTSNTADLLAPIIDVQVDNSSGSYLIISNYTVSN